MVSYIHRAKQCAYMYIIHRNIHLFPWQFPFSLTSKSDSGQALFGTDASKINYNIILCVEGKCWL